MATNAEIQKFVQRHHSFVPKMGGSLCQGGSRPIDAPWGEPGRRNRDIEPCPPEKREAIEEALRHFGMI